GAGDAATTTASAEELVGAPLPSDETYKGLPVGFTEQGLPYRGDPNAPIVMIEYSDYQCPFCNRYFVQTEPALDEAYVREGQVRVVFYDMPLAQLHPNAPAAHEAALCVAEQGSATRYWEMHSELFRSVEEWETAADPAPIFERLAEEVGADMEQYAQCVAGDEQESIVQARVQTALARGFSGTPSFQFVRAEDNSLFALVGAQPFDEFAGLLNAVLAGETPQTAQQPERPSPGIPFWATAEGWAPDPERPGYNMAGDQYRGSLDAPLTIVEFSDFQCPYCKRHVDETQAALDEKYVDTGKVLWIFKHFPLNIHPQAPAAGVAAECAGEQGQFWEMHHLLFADPNAWSIENPSPVFIEMAGQLGLDDDAFAACLDNPEMAARVDADLQEGAPYVQGTPTFILINGQRGSIIPGALPAERFSSVIDEELATLEATPSN
ncbi:MAG TPA: thioredoxin domain-containing protein, partial [Caldilineaceae bacterium]|nr:thioredoxin domain-containing protein [Caldilineaceae bacterium]